MHRIQRIQLLLTLLLAGPMSPCISAQSTTDSLMTPWAPTLDPITRSWYQTWHARGQGLVSNRSGPSLFMQQPLNTNADQSFNVTFTSSSFSLDLQRPISPTPIVISSIALGGTIEATEAGMVALQGLQDGNKPRAIAGTIVAAFLTWRLVKYIKNQID
jgi:hypothetical protein